MARRCETCGKHAGDGAAKAKLARTECFANLTSWLRRAASCGARAAKFGKKLGEPSVGQPRSQEMRGAYAIERLHPKEKRFLGSPKLFTEQAWMKLRQSY